MKRNELCRWPNRTASIAAWAAGWLGRVSSEGWWQG